MEDITVKCPKCRLTFNTPLQYGATSVDCVCPRCGMPFVHNIPIETNGNVDDIDDDNVYIDIMAQRRVETKASQIDNNILTDVEQEKNKNFKTDNDTPTTLFTQRMLESGWKVRQSQRRTTYKLIAFGIAVVALLLFFFIRGCSGKDKSYRAADIVITETEDVDMNRVEAQPSYPYEKTDKENIPDWLQGTWSVNTDFGNITIKIKGNRITEKHGDKISSGMFYYTWSKLNCNFGDGKTFVYFLDEERQLIDAGDGLFMEKIER